MNGSQRHAFIQQSTLQSLEKKIINAFFVVAMFLSVSEKMV